MSSGGAQERVQQRTVEQLADVVPMGADSGHSWAVGRRDQVVEVLSKFDVPSVEQVIAVPMISFDRVPQRSAFRRPQKAEQLVEGPTEPGCALAVIAVKALGRRAAAALAEQIVDIPVPQVRRGGGGGVQGSRAGQNSTAADVEQIVDIPAGHRGPQGFLPGQGSSSSRFLQDEDEGIHWCLSHFSPAQKNAPVECESARLFQLIRAERSSNGTCRGV